MALALGAAAGVAAHGAATVLTQIRRRKAAQQIPETSGDEGDRHG